MTNQLSNEPSLYLQQHAHNPVHWQPWSEAAFEQAGEEQKPLLISIGYAACHWCHVMEHESFEDASVAAYMNEHFICVKVDREEYPDVDDFYMTAVQAMTGSGGWPLNVFVTPDKLPFYGGTYFPPQPVYGRPSWMQVLERISTIWQQQPDDVRQQAGQMLEYLQQTAQLAAVPEEELFTEAWVAERARMIMQHADRRHGGFGRAPKFPSAMSLAFLLEYAHYTGDQPALQHALFSLDKMIAGGIYDQAGGGLARYATDDEWLVPHFEKMLYDNALFIDVLCDAFTLSGKEEYRQVIRQTISFVQREMKAPGAGFYSALDADSEGHEGKFYTWTFEEWKQVMQDFPSWLQHYWDVTEEGNWEETNILHIAVPVAEIAAAQQLDTQVVTDTIEQARQRLMQLRAERVRPATDDKCLLSWNALMNAALVKASVALDEPEYLAEAQEHMRWMLQAFRGDAGGWMHTWKEGRARIPANLDDLAFLVQAQLRLSAADATLQWLPEATEISAYIMQYFSNDNVSLLDFTSALENNLPLRKPEIYDGVTPSSNAVMAQNLYWLGMLTEHSEWAGRAEQMIRQMKHHAQRHPSSFAFWNILVQRMVRGFRTVAITGPEAPGAFKQLQKQFAPHCFYFFGKKENFVTMPVTGERSNDTQLFVCDRYTCYPPVTYLPESPDFTIF